MNFKPVRNLKEKEYNNLYEVSEDGSCVREISTQENVEISDNKVLLESEDKSFSREYGIRTLYRYSWSRALEMSTNKETIQKVVSMNKKDSTVPRRRKNASIFKAAKGKLLSPYIFNHLNKEWQLATSNGNSHIGYADKSINLYTVLKGEDKTLLIRVESQKSSQIGLWFVNLETEKHEKFIPEVHKKGYGNKSIVWPNLK